MSLLQNTFKKATVKNARNMIIFSYPKVGKTELMSQLPGKYLLLDFEHGSDFYDMNALCIDDLDTLNALSKEFMETKPHFDFIVLDTITSLYNNLINAIAVGQYNKEEKKNKPLDWDITLLSYGVGYTYKRNALQTLMNFFSQYCNCLISLGHVADRSLGGNDESSTVKDLDIEGKLKNILALKTDAMGLLFRSSANENSIAFTSNVGMIGGTRIPHLTNQTIMISKKLEDGSLETHWDKIFIK